MAKSGNEATGAFEAWLSDLAAASDSDGAVDSGWRRWLEDLFRTEGPVSYECVRAAATADQVVLAREATAAVLGDLERATDLRPEVEVDWYEGESIRISFDQGYRTPSMTAIDRAAAFVEVAAYFQEQLAFEIGKMWPECLIHDFGGETEVRDGVAVWWCRKGEHVVDRIGELQLPA
jgi:hypothetical protein